MMRLRRPDDAALEALRLRLGDAPPSYPEVGRIAGDCPRGYWPLCHQGEVGRGPAALEAARRALDRWAMIPPWVEVLGETAVGSTVIVIARPGGLYSINACRILAREESPTRHAITYGTLTLHEERGEERFLVELHADGRVTYEVKSFSRPAHPLVWLGFPVARWLQHRFARHSIATLRAEVARCLQG
ncbi:MAG: DUF1990 domain-containing protein [bacterium]